MMLAPVFESFEGLPLTVLKRENGEPWILAKDLAAPLGIGSDSIRHRLTDLEDSDKGVFSIHTLGGLQSMGFVSESGALQIICQSRKPAARRLRKWVCDLAVRYAKGELVLAQPNENAELRAVIKEMSAKLDGIMLGLAAARPRKPRVKKDPPPQSISVLSFHQTQLLRSGAETRAADLYSAYLGYCARNGAKAVSQNLFGRTMNALGLRKRRTRECWVYEDVELIQIGGPSL